MGTGGAFPFTHLHLVPRSRMRGAIPPLTQYVFMLWFLVKHRDNLLLSYDEYMCMHLFLFLFNACTYTHF